MAVTPPKSMNEVYYHTIRAYPDGGRVRAWAYRVKCPKCEEGTVGKPFDEKSGKYKIRSKDFVCNKCDYQTTKEEAEEMAELQAVYTCPHCGKEGEYSGPYKRKSFQGVQSYIVVCEHCNEKIPLTKKMKEPKKKK